jgi:hypothetical protein
MSVEHHQPELSWRDTKKTLAAGESGVVRMNVEFDNGTCGELVKAQQPGRKPRDCAHAHNILHPMLNAAGQCFVDVSDGVMEHIMKHMRSSSKKHRSLRQQLVKKGINKAKTAMRQQQQRTAHLRVWSALQVCVRYHSMLLQSRACVDGGSVRSRAQTASIRGRCGDGRAATRGQNGQRSHEAETDRLRHHETARSTGEQGQTAAVVGAGGSAPGRCVRHHRCASAAVRGRAPISGAHHVSAHAPARPAATSPAGARRPPHLSLRGGQHGAGLIAAADVQSRS